MAARYLATIAGMLAATTLWSFPALAEQPPLQQFTPVSDHIAQNPSPNDWLMWRRTYNSWGHSPLNQINTGNACNSPGRGRRSPETRKPPPSFATASCISPSPTMSCMPSTPPMET
jgi:hypothetical protein